MFISIENRDINSLKSAEYNPRKISKEKLESLKRSISSDPEFLKVRPIIVNTRKGRENIIIGGHKRWVASKELGMKTIPCALVDVDLNQEKVWNLKDNKLFGEFIDDSLADLLKGIQGEGIDLNSIGFDEKELNSLLSKTSDQEKEKPEIEFTEELMESHNYVVMYFKNDLDWLQAQIFFNLKTVKALHSKEKFLASGIGRVVDGSAYINAMNKGE